MLTLTFTFDYQDVNENTGRGFDDSTLHTNGEPLSVVRQRAVEEAAATVGSWFAHTATIDVSMGLSEFAGTHLADLSRDLPLASEPGFGNLAPVETEIRTGIDQNGSRNEGEIFVNFAPFYSYTDTVTFGQEDFKAAIMHELVHLVGFVSNILEDGNSDVVDNPSQPQTFWGTFDRFIADGNGNPIIDPNTFQLNQSRWDNAKTSSLTFVGPNAMAANGGDPVPLYSPTRFLYGTSASHLNDNDPNIDATTHLLVSAGRSAITNARSLHPIERGILTDIGLQLTSGLVVEQSQGNTAVFEGGEPDSISIALDTAPTSNVVVELTNMSLSGQPEFPAQLSLDPAALTFTPQNWNIPQRVDVAAVDDGLVEDGFFHFSNVKISVNDALSDDAFDAVEDLLISVEIVDNDVPGMTLTHTNGNTQVSESGTTDTIRLVLTAQPSSDVVVDLVTSDADEAVVIPSRVTFTPSNWNTVQPLTITGVDDTFVDTSQNITIAAVVNEALSDSTFDMVPSASLSAVVEDNEILPPILIVDSAGDGIDGNIGPGQLTLREAIGFAESRSGHDRIDIATRRVDLDPDLGPLIVASDVTIVGLGKISTTIAGGPPHVVEDGGTRVFEIGTLSEVGRNERPIVTIQDLTIQGGRANERAGGLLNYGNTTIENVRFWFNEATGSNPQGGAIYNGRGSNTTGGSPWPAELTLIGVDFDNNATREENGTRYSGSGGAIWSEGEFTIDGFSQFTENRSQYGGAIYTTGLGSRTIQGAYFEDNTAFGDGGAIYADNGVTIAGSQFIDNRAVSQLDFDDPTEEFHRGGAIFVNSAALRINESLLQSNSAGTTLRQSTDEAHGGAVAGDSANIRITRSTLTENWSTSFGGALYNDSPFNSSGNRIEIFNSTLSYNGIEEPLTQVNQAHTIAGGAVYNGPFSVLQVKDSTIYRNGIRSIRNGGGIHNLGTVEALSNSILVDNGSIDLLNETSSGTFSGTPSYLVFTSSQEGIATGQPILEHGQNNNIHVGDFTLTLGELTDNGGPVPTHLPPPDSVVIDSGFSSRFTDQRGFPVQAVDGGGEGIHDVGAVEVQQVVRAQWEESIAGASQFGPGNALVYGFGFDDGQPDADGDGRSDISDIQKEPEFLGFEFDPDRFTVGDITDGLFGDRYGALLSADVDGKFGFEYGFYANSGSVDVSHGGDIGFSVVETSDNSFELTPTFSIQDGSLYAISPRFGAYVDLITQFNADIAVEAAFVGTVRGEHSFGFDEKTPLVSINRQQMNEDGSLVLEDDGHGNMVPVMDGEIQFADTGMIGEIYDELKREDDEEKRAERDRRRAERDLARAQTREERQAARDRIHSANQLAETARQNKQSARDRQRNQNGSTFGSVKSLIGFELGEADGSLLGLQGTLSVGVGADSNEVGLAVGKDLGSLAVTIPDVQLVDRVINDLGVLSATTDDFAAGSELDRKRQIVQMNVDLAALTGFGGVSDVTLGPIGMQFQTVSYTITPTLSVTQDLQVVPYIKSLSGDFSAGATVEVNGEVVTTNGGTVLYRPGDNIDVSAATGVPVSVIPSAVLGASLQNNIGLDVQLDGLFEALSFNLDLFGADVLDIGPLFVHGHNLGEFDLGAIFDRTFDLPDRTITLGEPIELGGTQNRPGQVPGTPLNVDGEATFSPSAINPDTGVVFTSVDILDDSETFYQSIDLGFNSNVTSVGILESGLVLDVLNSSEAVVSTIELFPSQLVDVPAGSRFRIRGYSPNVADAAHTILALTFENPASSVTMTATPTDAVSLRVEQPLEEVRPEVVDRQTVDRNTATFEQNTDFDVDDNGRVEAATDGLLLNRYIAGVRGDQLTDGAVGKGSRRDSAERIANYISETLADRTDVDGNGSVDAATDGKLLMRYFAEFSGNDLITNALGAGASRSTAEQIESFLQDAQINVADSSAFDEADQTLNLRDIVETSATHTPNVAAGTTPWVPLSRTSATSSQQIPLSTLGTTVNASDWFLKDSASSTDRSQWQSLGTVVEGDSNRIRPQRVATPNDQSARDLYAARLHVEQSTRKIGTTAPIYIELPDADGFRITAPSGVQITELTIPHDVRGNEALASQIDVFVAADNTWHVVSLDESFSFPMPVTEFEVYHRSLPERSYTRTLEVLPNDVNLRLGLKLNNATSTTALSVTPLGAGRGPHLIPPDPIRVAGGQNLTFVRNRGTFAVRKDSTDALLNVRPAAIDKVSIYGTADAAETITLTLDTSGGPLSLPVAVEAGGDILSGLTDSVVLTGAGHILDLAGSVQFSGVELVDIRGVGGNTLRLNLQSVLNNRGTGQTLRVRADADDVIEFSSEDYNRDQDGWRIQGTETIGGVAYEIYQLQRTVGSRQQTDDARVLVEAGVTVAAVDLLPFAPSAIASYNVPGAGEPTGPVQLVTPANTAITRTPDESFPVELNYQQRTNGASLPDFLNVQLHYDSQQLIFDGTDALRQPGLMGISERQETVSDGDPTTDRVVELLWHTASDEWLGGSNLVSLGSAMFTTNQAFTGSTIRISAETANGFDLISGSVFVNPETEATLPVVTGPAGAISEQSPVLSWARVAAASSYEVWLEKLGAADNPVINPTVAETSFALTSPLEIGRYRTWVRATLESGETTQWVSGDFRINVTTTIADLEFHGRDPRPEISWTAVPGATSYRVYVRNSTAGTEPVIDQIVTETTFTPGTDLSFGRHHIWVQPVGEGNFFSTWSGRAEYFIGPHLLGPSGSTFDERPIFSWTSLPDVSSYQLYVSLGRTVVINESGLTESNFTPTPALNAGNYRWWVRGVHTSGRSGAWSELHEFTVGGSPLIHQLGETITDSTPVISWGDVQGAGSYEIYVFNDDGDGLVYRQAGLTATRFQSTPLSDGNYRVWVKSYRINGDDGRWSRPQRFVVDATTSDLQISPSSPVTPTFETTPTFVWAADIAAANFDVFLTDGQTIIHRTDLTERSFTPAAPLTPGVWHWWVRAKDSAGAAGPWSPRQTTDTSGRPVLLSPQGTIAGETATVSWTPVGGATRYFFQLDSLTTGVNSIIRNDDVRETSFTLTAPLSPGRYRTWVRAIGGTANSASPWSFNLVFEVR